MREMDPANLRVALFTGNYNYVRDGATQALNQLMGFCLSQGAKVRIYSPTVKNPAFPPTGDLVGVPSVSVPTRPEYRIPVYIPSAVKSDVSAFAPSIVHIASPEVLGHRAVTLARCWNIPTVASVHTRFETYFRYYGLRFIEPVVEAVLRRLYRRCDAIFAPSESMARLLREQRMNDQVGIWSRGVDTRIFYPGARSLAWRRSHGLPDDVPAIGFVGRLVIEKGLEVFGATIDQLVARCVPHRVVVVGQGPAREWFERRVPQGVFVGYQQGSDLGQAVASMDMLFNPSVTETFGNVTLEAMACGLPVVAAEATGSKSLVTHGLTGRLVSPNDTRGFADSLAFYCIDRTARHHAGQAGLRASARFSWDAVNQAMMENYFRVISRRRPLHVQGGHLGLSPADRKA